MRNVSMREYHRPAAVLASGGGGSSSGSIHDPYRYAGHGRPMTAGEAVHSPTTSPSSSSTMLMHMHSGRPTTAPNSYMWGKTALGSPNMPHPSPDEAGLSLEDRFPFLRDDRKRTRKLLTQEQTRLLEAILERTVYPSTPLREAIARYLGISPRKVQIWFQNKRQISRRFAHPGPVRGCGGEHITNSIMARGRRATEGSDGYDSTDRLMRYQSAEEDLRLAGLVDSEGRHFPELQYIAPRDMRVPATALGEAPWSERFHPSAPYDADYIAELRARQSQPKCDEEMDGAESSSSSEHRRHSSFEGDLAPRAPMLGSFTRTLPPPRRTSYMSQGSAQLAGRSLASLSDIALCHPEKVPALLSPTSPSLLSPIVFRDPRWRTLSATTDASSESAIENLAKRANNLRCDSPTSSHSSATTSPTTPRAPGQGYTNGCATERGETLPSIASLIFD